MKDIFEYLDYRKYLSDFFVEQRKSTPFFSFRYAESRVGIDASNLSKIVQGKRHITSGSLDNVVELLKLNEREAEYFNLLYLFSKTRSQKKNREYFEQLMSFNAVTMSKISTSRHEYYKQWYYSAALALLYFFRVDKDSYESIAKKLEPQITPEQAKKAVELLLRLNFISVDDSGYFTHTDSIITSGEQWKSVAIETFQRQTLELALRALDEVAIEERYISTLTVTLSDESYQKVRAITAEYRKAVLKAVSESYDTDRVYQINLQLFPMSRGDYDE